MSNHNVILIGGGGHARSLVAASDSPFMGYLAPVESPDFSLPYLGDDSMAASLSEEDTSFLVTFIYSGTPDMRKRAALIERYEQQGLPFHTFISKSAILAGISPVCVGASVMCGAIVNNSVIGEHAVINTGAIIEHDSFIGNNTFIGPGARIGGFCTIGNNCFIGMGALVKNGVKIADNVTVGMGSIVVKDITEPGIYYGNPLSRHPL